MFEKGTAYYGLDICVELDTQVVSYLKNIFKDWGKVEIPNDKMNLLCYLTRADVNYSSMPYMIENSRKIPTENFEECFLNLKSYEMFKHFDFKSYINTGQIMYNIDMVNMMISVDNTFKIMKSVEFYRNMKDFYDMQEAIYCILAKAISIEIIHSKKSAENKLKMLIEYVNDKLGVFCEREMAICYFYFQHDQRTNRFFRKVKSNSKNIFATINAMAWDLVHVRIIERWYDFVPSDKAKFGIHPLLTYDNGLKDVLKLYPIKKMAIYDGFTIPCFKQKFYELFPESIELIFKHAIAVKRKQVFAERNMKEIINELECELKHMMV